MGTNWKKAAVTAFASVALGAAAVAPAMAAPAIPASPPGGSHVVPAPAPGPLDKPEPEVRKPELQKPELRKPEGQKPLVPPALDTERPPVEVELPPIKAKLSAPAEVCAGKSVTLDASGSTGLAPLTYTFTYEGHSKPNSSGSSVSVPLNGPGNATVGVTVTGPGGTDSASKTVHVKAADEPGCTSTGTSGDIPGPPTVSLAVNPTEGCAPLKVTMTATGTADTERYDSIAGYTFEFEGQSVTRGPGDPSVEAILNGPGAVAVKVTVKTSEDQTASDTETVTVLPADDPKCKVIPEGDPDANARGDYVPTCDVVTVNFTGEGSTGTDPLTYAWDFNEDGVTDATGITATHTFGVGTHRVHMTVTDANAKTDTTQLEDLVVSRCALPTDPVYNPSPNFAG